MPSLGPDLTPLERAVFRAVCEMHTADRDALEAQLSTATVRSRENTGAGFYTSFDVQRDYVVSIGGEGLKRGPQARIDGFQHGMGFILWLKQGYLDCLEGYSYDDSTAGIDLERIGFEIVSQ